MVKEKEEEMEEEVSYLSMWSCRRCTLENPLQEAVCLACGGSRLSSIGDIEVPRTVEPRNIVNLIREEEEVEVVEEVVNTKNDADQPMPRWKCRVCTLENEALNYFCDACNSPSPLQAARKNNTKEEVINRARDDPNMELGIIFSKAVRLELIQPIHECKQVSFSPIIRCKCISGELFTIKLCTFQVLGDRVLLPDHPLCHVQHAQLTASFSPDIPPAKPEL